MLAGSVAYSQLEPDWSFLDCLYFTFVTISTIGYGCLTPTSDASRKYTTYAISSVACGISTFSQRLLVIAGMFTLFFATCAVPFVSGALALVQRPLLNWGFATFRKVTSGPCLRFHGIHVENDSVGAPTSLHPSACNHHHHCFSSDMISCWTLRLLTSRFRCCLSPV